MPSIQVMVPEAQPAASDAGPGPFAEAVRIEELAAPDANDDDPSLTGDLLEIYFKSDRGNPGDFDIWRARRAAADQPWGAPERMDELSSSSYEATPEVSYDGLVMYLSSSRDGGLGQTDIWLSSRASRADLWSAPVLVPELSSEVSEWAAATDESLTHVVITRAVAGHELDLLGAGRSSADDPWSAPVPLTNLATDFYEADGHLDASGRRLTFAAELPDGDGRDIYTADRPSPDADFAPPVRVPELSSPGRDEDPWVSPDGRLIVLSSDRSGDQELYWSSR